MPFARPSLPNFANATPDSTSVLTYLHSSIYSSPLRRPSPIVGLERGVVNSKRVAAVLITLVALFITLTPGMLRGALPSQPTHTWSAGPSLSDVREGATATMMFDGRILIAGGGSADGTPLASADIINADGSITAASRMNIARKGHAAGWVYDGYVLVTGGTVSGGGVTNTAELYDPLNDRWTLLPGVMVDPRSGHTATNLPDGRVLIAGGSNGSSPLASIETFSIVTEEFSFAGALHAPRIKHAAVALDDGRVAIIGGVDSEGVDQAQTFVFDPDTNQLAASLTLNVPRSATTATRLLDGSVLVVGGRNGANELATAEILNFASGTVTLTASLGTPRAEHTALLLADNNEVMIAGGKTGGVATNSVEIYRPWTGEFRNAAAMQSARVENSVINPGVPGRAIAIGGTGLDSTEVYAFATLKSEYADYYPGDFVTISGTGWNPGEQVSLQIASTRYSTTTVQATADSSGQIVNNEYIVPLDAMGAAFTITAVGSTSQAQTIFTDANQNTTTAVTSSLNPSLPGQNVTFTAKVFVTGAPTTPATCGTVQFRDGATNLSSAIAINATDGSAVFATAALTAGSHSITAAYLAGNGSCKFNDNTSAPLTQLVKRTSTTTLGSSLNPSSYNSSVTFTAAVTGAGATPTGTVAFQNGGVTMGTVPLTSGQAAYTTNSLLVGSYAITAQYSGDSAYIASSSSAVTQVVNKAAATITLGNLTPAYDGSPKAVSVTTNPVGLSTNVTYNGNPTPPSAVGSYAVVATITDPNYSGTASGTLVIGKAAATITLGNLTSTYDGSPKAVSVTTVPAGLASSVTYNGSSTAPTNAGSYAVVATSNDPNYAGAASGTLVIGKVDQAITFAGAPASADYQGTFAVSASSNSGLPVTILASNSCSIAGTTVTMASGSGTCVLTADQAGDVNHNPAPQVTQTTSAEKINQSPLSVTGIPGTAQEFGASFTVSSIGGNGAGAVTMSATGSCSAAGNTITMSSGNGTCSMSATKLGDENYNVVTSAAAEVSAKLATPIVTFTGAPASAKHHSTFDVAAVSTPARSSVITASGGCSVNGTLVTMTSGTTSCALLSTWAGDANYAVVTSTQTTAAEKADQTIAFAALSDNQLSGSTFNLSATSTSGLPVSFSAVGNCSVAGVQVTLNGAGTCSITASQVGDSDFNAAIPVSHSFTVITPTPVINWSNPAAVIYGTPLGGKQLNATASYSGSSLTGSFVYSSPAGTVLGVGAHDLTVTFTPSDSNYAPVTKTVQINILAAAISVAAPSLSRQYGDSNPTFTPQYSGFVNGESAAVLSANATCSSAATAASPTGAYPITCSAATASNYTFSYVNGSLAITKAPLTVTANNATKPQGVANPTLGGTIVGIKNNDPITATYTTTATQTSPVGTYPITVAASDGGSGVLANYTLTSTGATLTVLTSKADLIEAVSMLTSNPISGGTIQVSDTVTNIGGATAVATISRFYLSSNGVNKLANLGTRSVPSLATTASSGPTPTTVTLPSNVAGTYYIIACADDSSSVTEANEGNNCSLSTAFTLSGADLVVSTITTPAVVTAGANISLTDTTTNIGAGAASTSVTRFYLSSNGVNRVANLGTRAVPALASGAGSGPVATAVTLPTNIGGTYYLVGCADDASSIVESNKNNNCGLSPAFTVSGADMVVSSISGPAIVTSGATISVTDTTSNIGAGAASTSATRFYLSSNKVNRVANLGTRSVPALASAAGSGPVSTTVTLPTTAAGVYYFVGCADDGSTIVETNESNNCSVSGAMQVK